jgi:SAM-dependent methyltransferase
VIEHARARYRLRFERADIIDLPFEDASFDLVACFETIEHVREPEAVVHELRRVLAADGVLVISTPNPRRYLDPNPFHLSELAPERLVAGLRRYFAPVDVMYQDDVLTSLVLDAAQLAADDHPLDLALTKLVGLEPGHELYTVAVCGPGPRPRPLGVASGVYEAHAMAEELRAWPERAAEAERLADEWHARATEAERQVEEWRGRYAEIAGSTSWRLTRPLREARRRLRRGP